MKVMTSCLQNHLYNLPLPPCTSTGGTGEGRGCLRCSLGFPKRALYPLS